MVKAVIQRVRNASVTGGSNLLRASCLSSSPSLRPTVEGTTISSIGRGLLVLVGIGTGDGPHELDWLATKLLAMKLFPDDKEGEPWGWKSSVVDREGEVLCGELSAEPRTTDRRLTFASCSLSIHSLRQREEGKQTGLPRCDARRAVAGDVRRVSLRLAEQVSSGPHLRRQIWRDDGCGATE